MQLLVAPNTEGLDVVIPDNVRGTVPEFKTDRLIVEVEFTATPPKPKVDALTSNKLCGAKESTMLALRATTALPLIAASDAMFKVPEIAPAVLAVTLTVTLHDAPDATTGPQSLV
jgi:hypothetical protein